MVEPGGREGVADYTQALVEALAQRGHAVDLVTARDHVYRPVAGVEMQGLVPYVRGESAAGRFVRRARLGPGVNAARFVAVLPRIMRLARRADVVHLQGEYFPPLAALLARAVHRAGVPLVHTAHSTFDRGRSHARRGQVLLVGPRRRRHRRRRSASGRPAWLRRPASPAARRRRA